MIYKVSYVVKDGSLPGGIKNEAERPEIGHRVIFGKREFEITDVEEVMPPTENFLYLQATIEPLADNSPNNNA